MSNTSRSKGASKPVVSPLDAHLGYWLRAVSNHVSHSFKAKVERRGVTVAEWVVLRALLDEDGVKPSELAARLGLTRGTISKLVDRLANKGFVAIRGDEVDRRVQFVALTATGRRLVPKLAALADENDEETFRHLSSSERATLMRTLRTLTEKLELRAAPTE